ncbi:TolC family protein [Endomicrobium proavitum]|uniref:Outer membrane efflux protein n=1 Tax=Endomicrobium proavitum TaxID=1408281 RepID=A0A0G3WLH9_9BACT|nr:TolC family protein [Endomicrobium proavitum]AKL98359.1 exported protein of unknown function [Endomicrobium proavitum]
MKKILTFLTFLIAVCAANAQDLSLNQAVNAALQNNPGVAEAKENAQSASYAATAAKGKYLPRIDIVAAGVKLKDLVMLDLNDVRSAIIEASVASYAGAGGAAPAIFKQNLESQMPSFERKLLDDTFVRVMATAVQPIFTGFKISANASVKNIERKISEINFENAKNSAVTSVVEDYYRVKLAEDVLKIRQELQSSIERHVSNAQKLYKSGVISKTNLLRAEVALSQAKKEKQKSASDKELAQILFANTLGDSEVKQYNLTSPMAMLENKNNENFYVEKARVNNASLKLLNAKKDMLRQKRKAAVGNLLPNVAAVGQYQILQDKLTAAEPEWTVGITASLNVFGGGSDVYEIKSVNSELDAVDAQIQSVQNLIFAAVKKYSSQLQSAKDEYDALASDEKLAQENLKLYNASFQEGMATSLEVVDAQLVLTKIKIDRAKAVYDYNCAFANLLNICSMSQQELGGK